MRLFCISESLGDVHIEYYDDESVDVPYDIYEAACQADIIANKSGIHISSNKDLKLIALNDQNIVVGAVWYAFGYNDDGHVFDFDIAVDPEYRANGLSSPRIGIKLIDATLHEFQNFKSDFPDMYVRVWVVNPGLAKYLEKHYGFDVEAQHEGGSCHMIYHGN